MFFLKAFYWGQKGTRDNYALQFQNLVEHGYKSLGETPVIIGECGIPMDMKYVFSPCNIISRYTNKAVLVFDSRKEAFETENFVWHMRMMDAVISGLDRALVGFASVPFFFPYFLSLSTAKAYYKP